MGYRIGALIFRAVERTLRDEKVDALREKFLSNLNNFLGVKPGV